MNEKRVVVELRGREIDVVVSALGHEALARLCGCDAETGFKCWACRRLDRRAERTGSDWLDVSNEVVERLGRLALVRITRRGITQ